MKLLLDDSGTTHIPGGAGDTPTLCGWCGDDDEGLFDWPTVNGKEPSCDQCRKLAFTVAMLPIARKAMKAWGDLD